MSAHDWLVQVPGAVLGLMATVLGAIIVRLLRRLYLATQDAANHARIAAGLVAVTVERGPAVTLWEQTKTKAKAVLAGVGVAAVLGAEWLVENPDTARALEHVVPAPFTQLVPLGLGVLSVWLVHRVPNVGASSTSTRQEWMPAGMLEQPAPAEPQAELVPAAPAAVAPAPINPPTSFIPLPNRS